MPVKIKIDKMKIIMNRPDLFCINGFILAFSFTIGLTGSFALWMDFYGIVSN